MSNLPKHLFIGSDGHLYDTRNKMYASSRPLRRYYKYTHLNITNTSQLKATLRNNKYAWPGGYPLYFITSDGGALSFDTVRDNLTEVLDSIKNNLNDGWRVIACDINYENDNLIDDHTGEAIESAY